ncbi:unnamed protein product [Peniophora sp. CBMAI 1063]|nr:unnamed protein product [Peniophora sp. CBMAI 1063]
MVTPTPQELGFDASSESQMEGDELWVVFLQTTKNEVERMLRSSGSAMGMNIAYSSVFAAVVAAFAVPRYTNLSSHSSRMDTAITALWILAIVYSLLSALLGMMVLDWLAKAQGSDVLPKLQTIERYAQRKLTVYSVLKRYRLDCIGSLILGFMHLAVCLFFLGLCFDLYPRNRFVFVIVAAHAGTASVVYLISSAIPLLYSQWPYSSPLTYVLRVFFWGFLTLVACILLSCIFIVLAVSKWIRERSIRIRDLDPRLLTGYLDDPANSARVLKAIIVGIVRGRSSKEIKRDIDDVLAPARGTRFISGHRLQFLLDRLRAVLLKTPANLRYAARCLLNLELEGVCDFFIHMRSDRKSMKSVAKACAPDVESIRAAEGIIRLLQMIISAENVPDSLIQARTNQAARWRYMSPIVSSFPLLAARVGELSQQALKQNDVSLHVAVASLRWTLIVAMSRVETLPNTPPSNAMACIRALLNALDDAEGLRLERLTSSDHNMQELLHPGSPDPRVEIASRNAFTLLLAIRQCRWKSNIWHKPDAHYIPKDWPGMWDWSKFLPETDGTNAPSTTLTEFLKRDRLGELLSEGSETSAAGLPRLDPVALIALRDVAKLTSIPDTASSAVWESLNEQTPQAGPSSEGSLRLNVDVDESGPLLPGSFNRLASEDNLYSA